MNKRCLITIVLMGSILLNAIAQNNIITIKPDEPIADIQPTMWGIFFEDINLGADGGIYAELVKNRSFEFTSPMMGWKVLGKPNEGDFMVENRQQANTANPRFLHVTLHNNAKGTIGLSNEGFRGMGIKKDVRYDFSVMYRQSSPNVKMHIELVNEKGESLGGTTIESAATNDEWKKEAISFTANTTELKAKMNIWLEGNGTIDLDMVSLFPSDTWKNRPGGMRSDMIQLLADLKPGFIRFPGGCIVEGRDLANRYQWKKTIGPIEERQLIINRWNLEFAHRPTPDYFQTFGLGFFEYFQLAEDIGASPLPILNCGMACQFNTAEVVPLNQLDPYVQDALDLIEFANGDSTTKWGYLRIKLGHPLPFNLKMMGVGNENWGPQYLERLAVFTKAIKAKYPNIKLVNSSGTDPKSERFDLLNNEHRKNKADIIDEHYYSDPNWFLQNTTRYDSYDRNGPKIFAGEYAAQSDFIGSADNKNNWKTALSEAAFMTGLERNAGVVSMASYAPLFAHVDGWQWTPDLIWVNNLQSYGTPNYYVQKMFSNNKATTVIPAFINNKAITGQDSIYATAALDKKTNELVIKLVNISTEAKTKTINIDGNKKLLNQALITVLKSDKLKAVNSFENPTSVSPEMQQLTIKGKQFPIDLAPLSFTVLRVGLLN